MSFLDSLKQDALAVLHATANALHAQLANTLSQAGHPVSESDHVDTLVQSAQAAATGAAGAPVASSTAPNYADAALATFNQSMTAALVQFAQQHLPAKFQGVAADAVQVASGVLADGKVTADEIAPIAATAAQTAVAAATDVAAAAADKALPGAGALVSALAGALESAVASKGSADTTPAANTSGV